MTQHYIAIEQIVQLLTGARRKGLDITPLLERAGIAPGLLNAPRSQVTQAQVARLVQLLTRRMRDEFWGLCQRPVPLGSLARTCQLLIHCRTLEEGLRLGFAHYRGWLSDFVPRLQVQRDKAFIRAIPVDTMQASSGHAERALCLFAHGLASWFVGRRIPIEAVMYRPMDQHMTTEAQRIFQAPVEYESTCIGLRFSAHWLQLPIVQTPDTLDSFLRATPVNLLIQYRGRSTISERVRRLLQKHLRQDLTLEALGDMLAMTPQTLRRRLREEGLGFRELKDELRYDVAIAQLARPEVPLEDIAHAVGFEDLSSFHRAFKAWTGLPPGAYRSLYLEQSH